jgi:putative CocE/NonD family hydrolase
MSAVQELPERLRVVPHVWIPMRDGVRLSARLWLPESAEREAVPAILEYIPYRKDDSTLRGDQPRHSYLASHGYACVRVDLRGSGSSEGILRDEYLPQEQDDAEDVLAWLAEQPWCTGRVGMIGISWGGFNGLQVAARRPPQLGCVVSLCSTDDRYADDVHYLGGTVLGADMLSWASTMLAYNARPPDPEIVGERWRESWLARLEQTPPYIEEWLAHQRRDAFWKQGSVCEDYDAITCPVYMVGGWNDGYTNAIPRFLAGYRGACKGLIGPWSHNYPEHGVPGPAIGFLQETLRWFDHWLRDRNTGIMDEPRLRVWLQEWVPPAPFHPQRPGRWVTEPSWPSPNVGVQVLPLGGGGLGVEDSVDAEIQCPGLETHGLDAGTWCPYGAVADEPPDQREEDGRARCLDSAPLRERLELLGSPAAVLELTADRPLALVAVRLCDVAPDGSSLLLTRGVLNLTHRSSHEYPERVPVGARIVVRVELNALAQAVPAGHRLRLAVSPSYWPWAWPSPERVTLTLHTAGDSRLELPVRAPRANEPKPEPFAPPESGVPLELETLPGEIREGRRVSRDVAAGRSELRLYQDSPSVRIVETGTELAWQNEDTYSIVDGDPLSAAITCRSSIQMGRDGWRTRIETESTMTATRDAFLVTNSVEAFEGDTRVFARSTERAIPRDLG